MDARSAPTTLRALAVLVAVALLPVVLIGGVAVAWVGPSAAQEPNPFAQDGALCCAYPDTWVEVGRMTALTAGFAALVLVACVAIAWLLRWAVTGRRFGWRVSVAVPLGGALLTAAVIGLVVATKAGSAVVAPACDDFDFDRSAWVAEAKVRRQFAEANSGRGNDASFMPRTTQLQILGLANCPAALRGQDKKGVEAALGLPDWRHEKRDDPWQYGPLQVTFGPSGRFVSAVVMPPVTPDW